MEMISQIVTEGGDWLVAQRVPLEGSAEWYAHNNFRTFLASLKSDPSKLGIERAVHTLRHHIVDQFEWASAYCRDISDFCDRADRIRKAG